MLTKDDVADAYVFMRVDGQDLPALVGDDFLDNVSKQRGSQIWRTVAAADRAPTHRRVAWAQLHVFRTAGDKIAEHSAVCDDLRVLERSTDRPDVTTADPTPPSDSPTTGASTKSDDAPKSASAAEGAGHESRIAAYLAEARRTLDRVAPEDLEAAASAGALIVDIRPAANRELEGALPGAVVVERIHLEWRLDPSSPHRIPEAAPGRRVVVVCNEGYSSSLAARVLCDLGVPAADLAGGFRAWRACTDARLSP